MAAHSVAVEYLSEPSGKNLGAKGLCTRWRVSSYDRVTFDVSLKEKRWHRETGDKGSIAIEMCVCVCFCVEINESQCVNVHHPLSSSDWDGGASSRQVVKSRETLFRFLYLIHWISRVGGGFIFSFDFVFLVVHFVHHYLCRPVCIFRPILSRLISIIANVGRAHIPARGGKRRQNLLGSYSIFRWFCVFFFFFIFIFSHVERSLTRQTFRSIVYNTQCPVYYIYIHSCVCVYV